MLCLSCIAESGYGPHCVLYVNTTFNQDTITVTSVAERVPKRVFLSYDMTNYPVDVYYMVTANQDTRMLSPARKKHKGIKRSFEFTLQKHSCTNFRIRIAAIKNLSPVKGNG
jgi:hypothetical protein